MNTIREIEKINQEELDRGLAGTSASWHQQYANSAWVYAGNLDHELTEGDIICVLSQFGEIEDIHLVREEETGKSRGFAFVKYEDARSCAIAVDNLIGSQLLGRSLRIDHVEKYKLPKKVLEAEEAKEAPDIGAGHAYKDIELKNQFSISRGQDLFSRVNQGEGDVASRSSHDDKKRKRKEKHRKKKDGRQKHDRKKKGRWEHGRKEERRYDESSDTSRQAKNNHQKKRSRVDNKCSRSDDDDLSNDYTR